MVPIHSSIPALQDLCPFQQALGKTSIKALSGCGALVTQLSPIISTSLKVPVSQSHREDQTSSPRICGGQATPSTAAPLLRQKMESF